ncbi:hypothetical protein T492DRAFT_876487, partial [Pavlovales sp. CCMP2436]
GGLSGGLSPGSGLAGGLGAGATAADKALAPLPGLGGFATYPPLDKPTRTISCGEVAPSMCWHRSLETHLLLLTHEQREISLMPVHSV